MDWIRENKPLAVIFGIIIAGTLGLGYLLFGAWSQYSETKDNYLAMGSQVAALKGSPLSPTLKNVEEKKKLVDEYAANVNSLGGALLILQPPVEPIKDIEFQAKLKAKIAEARKMAGEVQMSLPPDFAYGFEEYTSGLPKSPEAAAELSRYLDAMDSIVKLFMSCRVESVDLLERSKLAVEQSPSVPAQQGAGQQGIGGAIYEKRQVSAIVTLDQGALQLLISKLANPSDMKFFTSLRLLRIENQRLDGPLRADVRLPEPAPPQAGGNVQGGDPAQATGEGGAKPVASDEIRPPDPAPVDSIPVIGEEKLKARLEIDLVKFLDAAKGIASRQPAGR